MYSIYMQKMIDPPWNPAELSCHAKPITWTEGRGGGGLFVSIIYQAI